LESKLGPNTNVLTKDDIIATFKDVRPNIKEYLSDKSVPKKEINRIMSLTINRLFKSNPNTKITQEKINELIIEKLNDATHIVFAERCKNGKILTLLEASTLSKSIDDIFNKMEPAIFSEIAA
jgi:transcriptional regulator NrdR family protein